MRKFALIAAVTSVCVALSGCWAVFIPGSMLEPGSFCVGPDAVVGGKIKLNDGRIGTIKALYGTSNRCSPQYPVKADLEF
jgi:hypothetical protein